MPCQRKEQGHAGGVEKRDGLDERLLCVTGDVEYMVEGGSDYVERKIEGDDTIDRWNDSVEQMYSRVMEEKRRG